MLSILLFCLRLTRGSTTSSSDPYISVKDSTTIPFNTSSNIPLNSSHNFRVANGKQVNNMLDENNRFDHVVRVITILVFADMEKAAVYVPDAETKRFTGFCTGMKILPEQIDPDAYGGINTKDDAEVSTKYVLTAAHCLGRKVHEAKTEAGEAYKLDLKRTEAFVVSDEVYVRPPTCIMTTAPQTSLQQSSSSIGKNQYGRSWHQSLEGKVRRVKSVSLRSNYNFTELYNANYLLDKTEIEPLEDTAIIELDSALKLKGPVIPLEFDQEPTEEATCRFAGWGTDEYAHDDDRLKEVKTEGMRLLLKEECGETVEEREEPEENRVLERVISYSRLCLEHRPYGDEVTSTTCDGDSGGPLMCKYKGEEKIWGFLHGGKPLWVWEYDSETGEKIRLHRANCRIYGQESPQISYFGKFTEPRTLEFLRTCIKVLKSNDRSETMKSFCGIMDMEHYQDQLTFKDFIIKPRSSGSDGATCAVQAQRSTKYNGFHRSNSATPVGCDILLRAAVLWMGIIFAWF